MKKRPKKPFFLCEVQFFFEVFLGIRVNSAAAPTNVVPANIVPATVMPSRSAHNVAAIPPTTIKKAKIRLATFTHIVPFSSLLASFTLFLLKSILASCSFSALVITQSTSSGFTSFNLANSSAAGNMESSTMVFCSTMAPPVCPNCALLCCANFVKYYINSILCARLQSCIPTHRSSPMLRMSFLRFFLSDDMSSYSISSHCSNNPIVRALLSLLRNVQYCSSLANFFITFFSKKRPFPCFIVCLYKTCVFFNWKPPAKLRLFFETTK